MNRDKPTGIRGRPIDRPNSDDEREHLEKCPTCGTWFDRRDWDLVAYHALTSDHPPTATKH